MKLILNVPTDYMAHVLGAWLFLEEICMLEVAMCSTENRDSLGPIYEYLSLKNIASDNTSMERQLDWLLVRRVRLRSFLAEYPLQRSAFPKIIALLELSKCQLRCLDINDNSPLISAIATTVARHCTQLEVVRVGSRKLCAPLFAMCASLQNLKELTLYYYEEFDDGILNDSSSLSVTTLDLHGAFSANAQNALMTLCPKLMHYSIDNGNEAVLDNFPTTVLSIEVISCEIVHIRSLNTRLTKFSAINCDITENIIASLINSCAHLRELDLTECQMLTDVAMVMIGDAYQHSLESLILDRCGSVTSDGLSYLFQKCKAMTFLKLGGNPGPQSFAIDAALNSCVRLRTLDISDSIVTDATLGKIAAAPLAELIMVYATGYTEKGLLALMEGCTSLKYLSFQDNLINPLVKLLWLKMRPDVKFKFV